jgi:radical SAM superfamily enzyme YgiQ (UPF0313 family)
MVGLPKEDWDTVQATANLIKSTKPEDVSISMITPYPGTPLSAFAKENKMLITEDWSRYTTGKPVMAQPGFSGEDMLEATHYLYGVFSYSRGLSRLRETLRKHRMQKIFGELKESLLEIGTGAYIITRLRIRTKLRPRLKN